MTIPDTTRCFMRYTNTGQIYRICESEEEKVSRIGKKQKRIAEYKPPQLPADFLSQINKRYTQLTDGQRREYQRLATAQHRAQAREGQELNVEQYKVFLENKRADTKLERQEDKLRREKEREEKTLKSRMEGRGKEVKNKEDVERYFDITLKDSLKKLNSATYKENFLEKAIENQKDRKKDFYRDWGKNKTRWNEAVKERFEILKESIKDEIDKRKDSFDDHVGVETQRLKEKLKVRKLQALHKLEQKQKDIATKNNLPMKWVKKNVSLIFDEKKKFDIKDALDIKKLLDSKGKIEEIQEKIDDINYKQYELTEKKKKKLGILTKKQEKEKKAQEQAEKDEKEKIKAEKKKSKIKKKQLKVLKANEAEKKAKEIIAKSHAKIDKQMKAEDTSITIKKLEKAKKEKAKKVAKMTKEQKAVNTQLDNVIADIQKTIKLYNDPHQKKKVNVGEKGSPLENHKKYLKEARAERDKLKKKLNKMLK